MPVRDTCYELISRLRDLIDDQPSSCQTFSDDQLQTFLDARCHDVDLLQLRPQPAADAGKLVYLAYTAPYGNWEEGATLVDRGMNALAPASADYEVGRWTFAAEPDYPVYLSGRTFDLYGAAADALEAWAAKLKLKYDFESADQRRQRSQQVQQTLALAKHYRGRQRVRSVKFTRSDINPGSCSHHPRRPCF